MQQTRRSANFPVITGTPFPNPEFITSAHPRSENN